jgi:peroxiredoxin
MANKNKKIILGISAILLLILLILILGNVKLNYSKNSGTQLSAYGVKIGQKAVDFEFIDIEGLRHKLSDFQGKYVLVGFIATWCLPCQLEAKNIRTVRKKFPDKLVVIQIAVDNQESKQSLVKFKNDFGESDWLMALDPNLEIVKLYDVKSFDTTLLIDLDGRIIYRDEGWPMEAKTLEDLLKGVKR